MQHLQTKIQQEGAALIGCIRQNFKSSENDRALRSASGPNNHRKRVILSALEHQWHGLWIKCLEFQFKYEQCIRLIDQVIKERIEETLVQNQAAKKIFFDVMSSS